MAILSGYGTPHTPIRVEHQGGDLATLATADAEGWWSVAVEPGQYTVTERYGASQQMTASDEDTVQTEASEVSTGPAADNSAAVVSSVWTVRHGDTAHSDVWAVLDAEGAGLNLANWEILAQARDTPTSTSIVHEWTTTHGITLGTATVRLADNSEIETSTVQLHFDPTDYDYMPRVWSGVFDVEITQVDSNGDPLRRYTIVEEGRLTVRPDVSRA